jgi:hypothetical protein
MMMVMMMMMMMTMMMVMRVIILHTMSSKLRALIGPCSGPQPLLAFPQFN